MQVDNTLFATTEYYRRNNIKFLILMKTMFDRFKRFQYNVDEVGEMIKRERYIQEIRPFYKSDLIKIITGVRRAGKSVVLDQIIKEILAETDNVIYLNFEDKRVSANISNSDGLIKYVENKRKQGKCFLFFDEIQVLDGWQEACRTLRLDDNSLFITGSNSKLLSSEFTKELSGRYVAFRIRPFIYKEIVEYATQLHKEVSILDYLIWGGFPKRIEFDGQEAQRRYLNDLDDTIIINDLVNRYHIRKINLFKYLVNFILRSNSRIFSAKSIHDYVKQEHHVGSVNTIMKFLGYLEEAYVIETVKQYSTRTKRELAFFTKIYNADVALNSIRCMDNRYDLTHNLENIIYNELLYMGYDIYVYNNKGKEIDFLAQKGNRKYFVQVAYSVAEDRTYERELAAFRDMDNLSQKVLITTDDFDYSTSTIRHIKLKDFLLMNDLST